MAGRLDARGHADAAWAYMDHATDRIVRSQSIPFDPLAHESTALNQAALRHELILEAGAFAQMATAHLAFAEALAER